MNFKAILIVSLLIGAIAVPLAIAAPMQAYVNAAGSGDLLRTQDRDRDQLQLRDCDCNNTCDGTQDRDQIRLRDGNCTGDGVANSTMNMEQYRYQYEYQHRNRTEQPIEA